MTNNTFRFPKTAEYPMTGERYIPGILGPIQLEHFHRYLFAVQFVAGRDVIDVASGEGYGSALLSQAARSVVGVDVDAPVVAHANRQYGSPSVSYLQGDATRLPCASASADVVVSFETIEHLENHAAFVAEVRRVLRPDGLFIVSTPDRPIYDATLTEENRFHLKEMERAEFQDLLNQNFRHTHILEQRSICGSVMLNPRESAPFGLDFLDSRDGFQFQRTQGSMDSPFLVALATDGVLPVCGMSVMNSWAELDKLRGDLGYATAEMYRLQAQVDAMTKQLQTLQALSDLARAETRYLRTKLKTNSVSSADPTRSSGNPRG
jgi:SAM-dependent methyltransferase